jgi:pyruvate dehydrogenase E2 component (dihydrolipoamide acetyltransferase)
MLADVESAAGKLSTADGYEPLRGVRRGMADAMERAAAVIAATVTDEALVDHWPAAADPTVRLIRAIVAGSAAAPELNASYDAVRKARRLHAQVDIGIAMETSDGLFAPVLRNAGGLTGAGLRTSLDEIKRGVVERTLGVADLQGASIALSNFGMLGGLTAELTIVPPQVAILGAGRIHDAPRVVGGVIKIAKVLPLSLTFDHRAVTGAEAIRFLNAVIGDLGRSGDE